MMCLTRVDSSSSNPSMTTGAFLALALAAIAVFLEHADGARLPASSRSLVQLVEPMGAGKTFGTLQGAPGGSKYGALQHQPASDSGSGDSSDGASAASAGGVDSRGASSATGGSSAGTVNTPTSQGTSSATFTAGSPVPVRRNTPNPASDSSQSTADTTNAASNNPF